MTTKRQREEGDLDRRLALKLVFAGASALLASKGGSVLAADGGEIASQTTVTRLLENERVEVVRMVSVPGDKGAMRERSRSAPIYLTRGEGSVSLPRRQNGGRSVENRGRGLPKSRQAPSREYRYERRGVSKRAFEVS